MKEVNGNLVVKGGKLILLKSRENSFLTEQLLKGAIESFKRHGGDDSNLMVVTVPSNASFCHAIRQINAYYQWKSAPATAGAIICLGAVCPDDDKRFLESLHDLATQTKTPVFLAIADGNSLEDVVNKCGVKAGNLGSEAVEHAIELRNMLIQLNDKLEV